MFDGVSGVDCVELGVTPFEENTGDGDDEPTSYFAVCPARLMNRYFSTTLAPSAIYFSLRNQNFLMPSLTDSIDTNAKGKRRKYLGFRP